MISAKTIKKTALAPTVLLTHGGSFLAYHLAQTLLLKNCRVVVLSNVQKYPDAQLKSLTKSPKFALFDCDINTALPDSIDSVDYIFHLANYEAFINADARPDLEALLSAGVGTKHLLDLAKSSQAKFALVCPVTSKPKAGGDGGFESALGSGLSVEDAKNYSKSLTLQYRERYELDARLVYLGQIYGVGMDLDQSGELGGLIRDLIDDRPLKVCNDGMRKEFYTFFTDAISGLVKSLFSTSSGGVYTLTEQNPHTSLEIAYLVKSLGSGKTDLAFAESTQKFVDPKLDELSYPATWQPRVELKDGLVKTLKGFGYKPNTKAFKAGTLIDERATRQMESSSLVGGGVGVGAVADSTGLNGEQGRNVAKSDNPEPEEPRINPIKLVFYRIEKKFRQADRLIKDPSDSATSSSAVRNIKIVVGGILGITCLAGVLLGVPVVQSYSHAKSALKDLENYQTSIAQLDSVEAQKLSENAYSHLVKLETSLNRAAPLLRLVGKSDMLASTQALTESAKNFSSALYSLSLGAEPFGKIWDGLKPDGYPDYKVEEFTKASAYFTEANRKLSFAKASLTMVNRDNLPASVRNDFDKYSFALTNLTENSDLLTQVALEFPNFIGLTGQKRYLILFQNSNELRPTGGFLGSYASVEVRDGKIVSVTIDDVYNPDGQLKLSEANREIKTPLPVAQALAEENLYIRNANWDPSFPQSTQTITRLFKLADGRIYDGVFAVDLYFARDLLAVTGPVYLTAYDEEIRVDNMYERAQFHSDFDFKEGVSSKQEFLTVLGGKMLEKVFALPQEKIPALFNMLYASFEQKHLLTDLSGSYLAKYLAEKGWDGSLLESTGDFLYVVNANVGGTKSNYYVKNDMNYAVSAKTSDGLLRGELELAYEHTQKDNAWPGGPYKNYVRVLVADGSKLTGAFLIGGQEEAKLSHPDGTAPVLGASNGTNIYDKVIINKVGKYTSFEFQLTVYPQEKVKLLFTYDLPQNLSAKKDTNTYRLVWQKQPGTQNDSIRFMLASPFGTKISDPAPAGTFAENIYEYKGMLNSDLRLNLRYK